MNELTITLAETYNSEGSVYRLMELPPELVDLAIDEGRTNDPRSQLTIRGREDDDAVLCTVNRTYNIRAVVVSNSFYVLTPPSPGESGDAVVRGNVKQILELNPSTARLHKLRGLLRDCEYDGDVDRDYVPGLLTDVKHELQASDAEFEAGLKERHILVLKNELRPMTMDYLNTVLELLLNALVSASASLDSASASDIAETLQCDHEIPQDVVLQVMSWFGNLTGLRNEQVWSVNVSSIVKQVGFGLLSLHRSEPIDRKTFLTKWRAAVGDRFEDSVDLSLLQGNFIASQSSATVGATLTFFPSSELPIAPADRFSDLFLVQSRWSTADMYPFLIDIAIDAKERDRFIMKFTRSVTDKDGIVWLTSRASAM